MEERERNTKVRAKQLVTAMAVKKEETADGNTPRRNRAKENEGLFMRSNERKLSLPHGVPPV